MKTTTTEAPAGGITAALARYAVTADLASVRAEAVQLARRTLTDTVAVALAGGGDEAVRIVRETMTGTGAGPATVLADGSRAAAPDAALLNATAAHALDYDDVVDHIYGHPSVVLWPAVLAAAESAGATSRQLAGSYLVGFDIEMALAHGFALREHYGRGWHSTATLGVVAAAAAVSRLLGSGVETTARALGIAATMAGGSRQNFGSMTKPLHAGLAARDGVLAASLAARGFTADASQLEGPLGYFALFGDTTRTDAVADALRQPPGEGVLRYGVNVKKYPACYNTQRTIDAALALAARTRLRPDEIERVVLTVEPGGFDPLIHHRPTTALQGKFSGEYVIAAALLDGRIALSTFTDAAVCRPEARTLIERIEVVESATPPSGPAAWDQAYAVIRAELADGSSHVERVDVPHGDHRAPLEDAELSAKLLDCIRFSGLGISVETLEEQLAGLGSDETFTGFPELDAGRRAAVLQQT